MKKFLKSRLFKTIFNILRTIVTLLLLYFIFRRINITETIETLKKSNILFLLVSITVTLIFHFLTTYRWAFALWKNKVYIKYLKLLRIHFISIFLQNFLPSSIGGDFIKGVLTFKGNPKIRIASSILISRLFGIFALISIANISLVFFISKNVIINKLKGAALIFLCFFIIFFFLLFNRKIQEWISKLYNSIKIRKLQIFEIQVFFEKINTYKNLKDIIIFSFLSLIIHIFSILGSYFLFLTLGDHIPVFYFFLYVPIIIFGVLLPISLNGLGLKEGLFYFFFKDLASSKEILISFLILLLLIRIFFSSIGSFLFLVKSKEKKY